MEAIQDVTVDLQVASARVEAVVETELDILNPDIDLPRYIELLRALYGFYQPLEMAVALSGIPWYFADWHPLRRTLWLEADLAYFDVYIPRVCINSALPKRISTGQAFGCQYAIEALSKSAPAALLYLGPRFNLTPEWGLRLLSCAGLSPSELWCPFQDALNSYYAAHPDGRQTVTDGAQLAFAALDKWLQHVRIG